MGFIQSLLFQEGKEETFRPHIPVNGPVTKDSVQCGSYVIEYSIKYSPRKKNATLIVHPDKNVEVRVPPGTRPEYIRKLVERKGGWVMKKLQDFESRGPVEKEKKYMDGNVVLYAGMSYVLRIFENDGPAVFISGQYVDVHLPKKIRGDRTSMVKACLTAWYRERANEKISMLLSAHCGKIGLQAPEYSVKVQKRRWGSCSSRNRLNFNLKLAMAPDAEMEYVVVHEICHIFQKDHSAKFWSLVGTIMPDYKVRMKSLKENGWKYEI
jgi:predicted metal-dependent hydrolase